MPMLLLMTPALNVVGGGARERAGSLKINLYVTPVTRIEFLLGKQLLNATSFVSFLLLVAMAVWLLFNIPPRGCDSAMPYNVVIRYFFH